VRGKILSLGLEYGLMTPFTSLLALESEQAYASMGIKRRKRPLTDLRLIADASSHEKGQDGVLVGLLAALSSPLGCASEDKGDEPMVADLASQAEAQPAGARHKGEEGRMGKPTSKEKSGLYAIKGPKDAIPQLARDFDPDRAAREQGILGTMENAKGHFLSSPYAAPPAGSVDDEDIWGSLTGTEIGEAYGAGGLGLAGTGRGGGGTGSGYGRGSGAGFGGRGKPVPRVRMAKAQVKGALDKDIIRRVVRAHINEVRYCYNQGLVRDESLRGRIAVQFTIGPTGKVPVAVVQKSKLSDRNAPQCIAKAVRRWTFPKPQGGGNVVVTYPFVLGESGGSGKAAAPAKPRKTKPAKREKVARRPAPKPAPKPAKPAKPEKVARRPAPPKPKPKAPCSDASARSLAHRKILWERRLALQPTMQWALGVFDASAASCEIKGWKDERVFLQLLQRRANTEDDIVLVLDHFRGEPEARSYVARALLRRLVDPSLVGTVEAALYGFAINWIDVDRRVALSINDAEAIKILEEALARSQGAPRGEDRLIKLLAASGKISEALSRGNRLRERGLLTPALVQTIGEVLVADGREGEALRLFSEIVEFDPQSPASRRLLGDVFLRHGWFEAAYRQYSDLVRMIEVDASAKIRMARAAAETGRVDEALRILRKLAAGEGRPGADDPRRWARLHSAAYLARLLAETPSAPRDSVARELKRLQIFDGPTAWALLTWEDMDARLVARAGGESAATAETSVDAGVTGLFAVQRVPTVGSGLQVRHKGPVLDRSVRYVLTTIRWDGSKFAVDRETGEIPKGKASASETDASATG
jgi:tetratricopeptide (TPR) repeat protein